MSSDRTSPRSHLPAPCIIDAGIIVNKQDIRRLLCDLGAVRYRYTQDDKCIAQGEGYVVEVFSSPNEATLVANHSLYLNICSFDYLELSQIPLETIQTDNSGDAQRKRHKDTSQDAVTPLDPQKSSHTSALDQNKSDASGHHVDSPASADTSPPSACFCLVQENTRLQLVPLSNPLKARQNRTSSVALDAVVADMLSTNLDISDDDDPHFPF